MMVVDERIEVTRSLVSKWVDERSWADVACEAQKIVELALKDMLRSHGVEAPRVHDVSAVMLRESERLPEVLAKDLPKLAEISKNLRGDRELAFCGSEDLTPHSFYSEEDATKALGSARFTVATVRFHIR